MESNTGLSGAKIALLVDFDNVVLGLEDPGFDIELVVNALRERGTIVLGRVYGDWYRHNRHRRRLMEQGLELVETPAFGPVIKNSADIRIALDGFEIGLTQPHIDTFAIVSGDSDFLPLIKKLQSLGRRVLVICGNRFTSDMLRRNCNEFISYENLLAQSVGAAEDATTLEGAFSLLHRAMAALRERGSEIRGSGVKQMMLQLNPVFSERTFGCAQFRQFLQKAVNAGVVKLGPRDKVSGEFHVLLPDEDETPIQQKLDKKEETRARREGRIAQIAARIEAVPVEPVSLEEGDEVGVGIELDMTADALPVPNGESDYTPDFDEGGAVFAEDAFGYEPEAMSDAATDSAQEIAQNVIPRAELLARGLRPSTRRFSGKNGRPTLQLSDEGLPELEAEPAAQGQETAESMVVAEVAEAEPTVEASPSASGENRRLRSRRRRRSASGQITVVSDEAGSEGENAPSLLTQPISPEADASTLASERAPEVEAASEGQVTVEFSHEPLSTDFGPSVQTAEAVEASQDAVAQVQTALDQLGAANGLAASQGVQVDVSAPPLSAENAAIDASAPSGQPLSGSDAVKPRRRAPRSRAKTKTASAEAETLVAPEPAPVVEATPAVEASPAVETASAAEEAPAKARRRRPSRTKKAVEASE